MAAVCLAVAPPPLHLLPCQWKFTVVHQVTQARYLSDEKDEQLFIQYFMINKERGDWGTVVVAPIGC